MRLLMIIEILLLTVPAAGFSGDPPDGCSAELRTTCSLRISVCPAGDFEHIREGCGGEGDYIEVVIYDAAWRPIQGIPPTDFWMAACESEYILHLCTGGFVADSLTGPDGRTTFSGQIAAGGCVPEGGLQVYCQGTVILDDETCTVPGCVDVVLVSPDLNADGAVNLSDLSIFGQAYNHQWGQPEYNPCCDYNDDDWCNLSDFAYFAEHYQHGCP